MIRHGVWRGTRLQGMARIQDSPHTRTCNQSSPHPTLPIRCSPHPRNGMQGPRHPPPPCSTCAEMKSGMLRGMAAPMLVLARRRGMVNWVVVVLASRKVMAPSLLGGCGWVYVFVSCGGHPACGYCCSTRCTFGKGEGLGPVGALPATWVVSGWLVGWWTDS